MGRVWIRAIDLETWASHLDARATLPSLVRRLVHAITSGVTLSRFPAEEGTQRRGWDGQLDAPQGNAWVPAGRSVWEVSTDSDPKGKATEDYRKRTAAIDPAWAEGTTFVFVTPRKWEGKHEWEEERRREALWRDVRVIDSADLEEWLERAPAVDAWLAALLGRRPPGVLDLSTHWLLVSQSTDPNLPPDVFLTGRTDITRALRGILDRPAQQTLMSATSPEEMIHFVAAVFGPQSADDEDPLVGRAVIVENRESWDQLCGHPSPLLLIQASACSLDAAQITRAIKAGHHVLSPAPLCARPGQGSLRLPRLPRFELGQALESTGFDDQRASRLARECGGCATVLLRLASSQSGSARPAWAQPDAAYDLLPLLMLGSWNEACPTDRAAVEALTHLGFSEAMARASRWLNSPDTPFQKIGVTWSLISRLDSWALMAHQLDADLLERFERLAVDVLGEDDPRYSLPPDERAFAGIRKQLPSHSAALREGLAETVALLATDTVIPPALRADAQVACARRIVRTLLPKGATAQRWFSLAPLLRTLAEAAPEEFLDSLETDLASGSPGVSGLFVPQGDGLLVVSLHHELLWALQILAWNPDYLTRVALILARLRPLFVGGRTSPTPEGVLRDIFLPWLPHTEATPAQRFEVIDFLQDKETATTRKLLLDILPRHHDASSPSCRPRWRDWPAHHSGEVDVREYAGQVRWTVDRLLRMAERDDTVLADLVERLAELPADIFRDVLARTEVLLAHGVSPDLGLRLWDILRKKVADHRYFPDADWALPKESVDQLASIEERLRPSDPCVRYRGLFGQEHHWVGNRDMPYDESQALLFDMRKRALTEIIEKGGLPEALAFAKTVTFSYLVGIVLAKGDLWTRWEDILPGHLTSEDRGIQNLASAYASTMHAVHSWDWVTNLPLSDWQRDAVVQLALALPFESRTWELLRSIDAATLDAYWDQVNWPGAACSLRDIEEAATQLLARERPFPAIRLLASAVHRGLSPTPGLIFDTVQAAFAAFGKESSDGDRPPIDLDDITELARRLQETPGVDEGRLALIEWQLIPLAPYGRFAPRALHAELARNPEFFCQCVCMAYRPACDAREEDAPEGGNEALDAQASNRARLAHDLLRAWHKVPGTLADGSIDAAALRQWVESARALCGKVDRLEICDLLIGEVLANAPPEPDESWPCLPVRDLLESTASDNLLSGLRCGAMNSRGVTWRTLSAGGDKERKIASRYHDFAKQSRSRWPRVSRTLREVAESYESIARRHDEDAREHG